MSVLSSPPKLGGVRGGLNRRKLRRFIRRKLRRFIRRNIRRFIRHIVPLFRPPLAPPNLGGEIVTPTVCLSMSKSTAKPRCRSLTVQRF